MNLARHARVARRVGTVTALAILPLGLVAGYTGVANAAPSAAAAVPPAAPAAAAVPVSLGCEARPPIGGPTQFGLNAAIEPDAPATVVAGSTFVARLAPQPMTVPSSVDGRRVNELHDLRLKVAVPRGALLRSARISGGSNLGTGTPQVSVSGNVATVTVPGPLAGGSTFQLPTLHLVLTATGLPGAKIITRLAGTSFTDPSLAFIANVKVSIISINVPASCVANPSPTFTSTLIV